jgi:putative tricarboxylic transport membrane protein
MIGFFGVAEALVQLQQMNVAPVKQDVSNIIPSWKLIRKYLPLSLRSSATGVVIGALPGTGGDIAALLAYDQARRSVKEPSRPFGEGAYEGIVAPESANNAAVGGAYIPMLTLGIPGDAVTAVIIGALYIHGLKPGPLLLIETPHLFWFTVGNLVLANVFLLIFGLMGIKLFVKLVECPKGVLIPLIVILSVVGTYSIQNSLTDVYWMIGFGVVGYFLKIYGYQVGPVILGVILGPLMDASYRRAMLAAQDSIPTFLWDLVSNPLTLALTLFISLLLIAQTPVWNSLMRRVASRSRGIEVGSAPK